MPLRALSPHHVYYGIFEGEEQRPGYMTVYEAWAELDGEKKPALFDAVARSLGLGPEIVLITGIGTWNYQNGCLLEASRRFRRGRKVKLSPAEPVSWSLYTLSNREAYYYSAFTDEGRGDHRVLAPFDAVTARNAEGPMGFISAWPELL